MEMEMSKEEVEDCAINGRRGRVIMMSLLLYLKFFKCIYYLIEDIRFDKYKFQ